MNKIVFILLVAFTLYGCDNKNKNPATQIKKLVQIDLDEHTAQSSLDYEGTYTGIIPAADAEGIETKITLGAESYSIFTEFAGKNDSGTIKEGKYSWNKAGNTITLEGLDKPNQYFVGENKLFALDINGNRIKGEFANNYILKKQKNNNE